MRPVRAGCARGSADRRPGRAAWAGSRCTGAAASRARRRGSPPSYDVLVGAIAARVALDPLDRPGQPFAQADMRLPAEQLARQRRTRDQALDLALLGPDSRRVGL